MITSEQQLWSENTWKKYNSAQSTIAPQLVVAFGDREVLSEPERFSEITGLYPNAHILTCSTSGEILDSHVYDGTIAVTALQFEKTSLQYATTNIKEHSNSADAGKQLASLFSKDGLSHIFVISDGQFVNGSELIRGLTENIPANVTITGGLAGDGAKFQKTIVGFDSTPVEGNIVAVGFYGSHLKIGFASVGGWDPFGPERIITKSKGNILYELDDVSALDLYKKYLGDKASGLPGSALLFPLSIRSDEKPEPVVRTILSVSEDDKSMTFAGDMPEKSYARLMKANFDRLIEGASKAAVSSIDDLGKNAPDVAILISCVGRKLVLDQRIEEEIEIIREVFGNATVITGFYSYGEISPFNHSATCELHNQTMTITTFKED